MHSLHRLDEVVIIVISRMGRPRQGNLEGTPVGNILYSASVLQMILSLGPSPGGLA